MLLLSLSQLFYAKQSNDISMYCINNMCYTGSFTDYGIALLWGPDAAYTCMACICVCPCHMTWRLLFEHLLLPLWLLPLSFHVPHDLSWLILVVLLLTKNHDATFPEFRHGSETEE